MEVDSSDDEVDGLIQSIHVKNFFCHENLVVTFNPNINFIVGRNGSGKSAILTALVVGLGARASVTNRGTNLHSFIRKGSNSATVEIKIKNSSRNAYKPEIYGDSITIVRNITSSGTSNYKIKSATGEVLSTKSSEVGAIVLALDIQVDNPISVLNQDDARSFHASDAKKKYALFRKATNLDITEINYQTALENCAKAKSVWQKKNEVCQDSEKELKKWQAKHDQLQSRDEIERNRRKLQDEYYWSEIADLEKSKHKLEYHHRQCNNLVQELTNTLASMEESSGSNVKMITDIKKEIRNLNKQKSESENVLRDFEVQLREQQTKLKIIHTTMRQQQDTYNREKTKHTHLEQEIENISSGETASRRKSLLHRAETAEEAARVAKARCATAHNDKIQAQKNCLHATQAAEEATARLNQQKHKLRQLKDQLRELQSHGGDALAVYGQNMVELCRRVKETSAKGLFSVPPRGPVGSYLKVKEKKWAGALEHIIGSTVHTFCVNSSEDSRKLFEIMNRVYGQNPKPGVTCSRFINKRHDVRRNTVRASGYMSALESLDIVDPVIANFLVDNISVETILLVPDHADATRLSDSVENVPANCSKIVTFDSTEYHPAPNYRSYGGANRPSRYLQVSRVERIKQVEAEIEQLEETVESLSREDDELWKKVNEAKIIEQKATEVARALYVENHTKEDAYRAAQTAYGESQRIEQHNVLYEELEGLKKKLEILTEQIQDLKQREAEDKTKLTEMEDAIEIKRRELTLLNNKYKEFTEKLALEQMNVDRNLTEKHDSEQKLAEARSKLERASTALAEKGELIQQKTSAALKLCSRIDEPREKDVVVEELKKTENKLKSLRGGDMSKEEVLEKLVAVQTVYKNTKKQLDELKSLINKVQKIADKHLNFCYQVQSSIARRVQYSFQSILTLRKYSARMEIDAANGTLDLWCSGRGRAGGEEGRASSTSALSGGERSYATVAFIMALWECAELPFCFMDEFDVFMDNVNRKVVMDLLIDHALHHRSRQFVFLTPQDSSKLVAGEHIKIHRMADPRD